MKKIVALITCAVLIVAAVILPARSQYESVLNVNSKRIKNLTELNELIEFVVGEKNYGTSPFNVESEESEYKSATVSLVSKAESEMEINSNLKSTFDTKGEIVLYRAEKETYIDMKAAFTTHNEEGVEDEEQEYTFRFQLYYSNYSVGTIYSYIEIDDYTPTGGWEKLDVNDVASQLTQMDSMFTKPLEKIGDFIKHSKDDAFRKLGTTYILKKQYLEEYNKFFADLLWENEAGENDVYKVSLIMSFNDKTSPIIKHSYKTKVRAKAEGYYVTTSTSSADEWIIENINTTKIPENVKKEIAELNGSQEMI